MEFRPHIFICWIALPVAQKIAQIGCFFFASYKKLYLAKFNEFTNIIMYNVVLEHN